MPVNRVGLVPSTDHPNTVLLHRASLLLSFAPIERTRWGRAAAGSMAQEAGAQRLPDVAACVVWGCDEDRVARLITRNACALMLLVLPREPQGDEASTLRQAMARVAASGSAVHVVVLDASSQATAWDLAPGQRCTRVTDLSRPPTTAEIPHRPGRSPQPEPAPAPARQPRAEPAVVDTVAPPRSAKASEVAPAAAAAPAQSVEPTPAKPVPTKPAPRSTGKKGPSK